MAEKRKDKKGRVLRIGESQRKDGSYQYRYKNSLDKYQYIYAPDLAELRQKEKHIQEMEFLGLIGSNEDMNVCELLRKYLRTKQNIRYHTRQSYNTVLTYLDNNPMGKAKITKIKVSDAKAWFISAQTVEGKGYGVLATVKSLLKAAFQMAYEDDLIKKNPFDFSLSSVIVNDLKKREPVDEAIFNEYLRFMRRDKVCAKYADEIEILYETGMRVSELCGLTKEDIFFSEKKIRVNKQLLRKYDGEYFITTPKTKSGIRFIPMTERAKVCFKNVLARRDRPQPFEIDGYKDFIFVKRTGAPITGHDIEGYMKSASKRFSAKHPETELPRITPHILRHSFCTKWAGLGMEVQNLSYLMGHSNSVVTLGVYTHSSMEASEKDMMRIICGEKSKKTG